jgi:hypothetical protein
MKPLVWLKRKRPGEEPVDTHVWSGQLMYGYRPKERKRAAKASR